MQLRHFWNEDKKWLARRFQAVERRVITWSQPAPDRAIKGVVSDLFRSRKDLIAENAFLRQQVIILNLSRLPFSSRESFRVRAVYTPLEIQVSSARFPRKPAY